MNKIVSKLGVKLSTAGNGSTTGADGDQLGATASYHDVVTKGLSGVRLRARIALSTATSVTLSCYDASTSSDAGIVSDPPGLLSTSHGGNSGTGELAVDHALTASDTYEITIDLFAAVEVLRVAVVANAGGLAAGDVAVVEVTTVEG